MRIITWNCRRANCDSAVWEYLLSLEPDVAFLQEVSDLSDAVRNCFATVQGKPIFKTGKEQPFSNFILVRGDLPKPFHLFGTQAWVTKELERFSGNVLTFVIRDSEGCTTWLVGVYSPAWPLDAAQRYGVDVTDVKCKLNRRLWLYNLIWDGLRESGIDSEHNWIVAGDLNMSETFDYLWKGGPRGNREHLDRMSALGFTEALRHHQGELVPTFRSSRNGTVLHQIDHVFLSRPLTKRLKSAVVGDADTVFGGKLSDHLPIIADLS